MKDNINFENQTIVLTGATGFLGSSFCDVATKLGARMILIDQDVDRLRSLEQKLSKNNGQKHLFFDINFQDKLDRKYKIESITALDIQIDVLINNAAFTGQTDKTGWNTNFYNQNAESFLSALEVNLVSAFDFSRSFFPNLKKSKTANILNVASIYSHLGPDYSLYEGTTMSNPAGYGASKAGLVQLTKWLATTMAPFVRVNAISPGGIFRNQDRCFIDRYIKKTPLGRMASESDIVDPMIFLISKMARYINGEILIVDGGYSCH